MIVTVVGGNDAELNARAATFAKSTLVKLIFRLYLDVFHQEHFIPINIDFHNKLILPAYDFVCKSAAPAENAQQENYKRDI